ncbi:MAG: hypothetical protein Q9167_006022 [Letrouitia subvulpina]
MEFGTERNSNPTTAVFDRMQFKLATANNGKRRAAQQYFNIVISLTADTRDGLGDTYKLASCMSQGVVVRGRSPGHLRDVWQRSNRDTISSISPPMSQSQTKVAPADETLGALSHSRQMPSTSFPKSGELTRLDSSTNELSSIPPDMDFKNLIDKTTLSSHSDHVISDDSSISSNSALSSKQSLSSVSSLDTSSDLIDDTADFLLSDPGLRAICTDGFNQTDGDRFQRNLQKLLESYFATLHGTAIKSTERRTARFGRRNVRNIANCIRMLLGRQSAQGMQEHLHGVEDEKMLKRYLLTDDPQSNPRHGGQNEYIKSDLLTGDTDLGFEMSSSDDADSGDDEPKVPIFQQIKTFLINGDPFEDLREGLIGLIIPILVTKRYPIFRFPKFSYLRHPSKLQDKKCNIQRLVRDLRIIRHSNLRINDEYPEVLSRCSPSLCQESDSFCELLKTIEAEISHTEMEIHDLPRLFSTLGDVYTTGTILVEALRDNAAAHLTKVLQERYDSSPLSSWTWTRILGEVQQRISSNKDQLHLLDRTEIEMASLNEAFRKWIDMLKARPESKGIGLPNFEKISNESVPACEVSQQNIWNKTLSTWKRLVRPPLRNGHRRVEWICDCGELLWADFATDGPNAQDATPNCTQDISKNVAIIGKGSQDSLAPNKLISAPILMLLNAVIGLEQPFTHANRYNHM